RRHTRFSRDWSSDVCSSDLGSPRRTKPIVKLGRGTAADADGFARGATTINATLLLLRTPVSGPRTTTSRHGGNCEDLDPRPHHQIGRASCRERVKIHVVAES